MEWDPNTDDWAEVGPDDEMYPAEWSSPQDADRGMIAPKTEPGKIVTKIEPGAQNETTLEKSCADLQDKIPEAMLDKICDALQEKMMKKIAMSAIHRPALHNGKGASSSSGLTIATRYSPYAPRVFLHDCKPSHPSIIHFVVSSGVDRFPLNISPHSYCIHPGGTSSPFFNPRAHGGLQGDPGGVRQAPQKHRQRAPGPSEIEGCCHQCASRFRHTPRAHGGLDFFYNKLKRCRPPFHMSMHVPFTHGITTNLSGVDRLST